MIKLFVGLGNPGPEYTDTRHNAGFWWIDALADQLRVTLTQDKAWHGMAARTTFQGKTIWLLKPQTFMNLSGRSVAALARFFKIAPHEILVAHDELDIVPGQMRLKRGGSHAGHNGLR
ncbi:MAG: aminoacyl-tRNA hydrolase, partial [Rhodoferax sp.]|nr:aminoacyl-tRNA hydrolase [Rhodoferax sp.]